MARRAAALLLLALLVLPAAGQARNDDLTVYQQIRTIADENFAPLSYYEEDSDTPTGAAVEILEEAMPQMLMESEYVHPVNLSRSDQLMMLIEGEVDILFPWETTSSAPAGTRSTGPMFYDNLLFLTDGEVLEEGQTVDEYLAGAVIGVTEMSTTAIRLAESRGGEVRLYHNDAELYVGLQMGQVDVIIQREMSFEEDFYEKELFSFQVLREESRAVGYGYLVADKPGLRQLAAYLSTHTTQQERDDIVEDYRVGSDRLVNRYISLTQDRWVTVALMAGLFWAAVALRVLLQRARRRKDRMEMQARLYEEAFLQAQIKPHFLYNALGSVMNMCYVDGEAAGDLLGSLTSYLRILYDTDNSTLVPLEREMELVRSYVAIELARFDNRFRVEYDVPPDLLAALVPPLTIQPLVENAIRHGLHGEAGTVAVQARRDGEMLRITVTDDGVGMSEQQLLELWLPRDKQRTRRDKQSSGVGLQNIRRRVLRLHRRADLYAQSEEGKGTRFVLLIPYTEGKGEDTP